VFIPLKKIRRSILANDIMFSLTHPLPPFYLRSGSPSSKYDETLNDASCSATNNGCSSIISYVHSSLIPSIESTITTGTVTATTATYVHAVVASLSIQSNAWYDDANDE
jgi:hypothetical protein